MFKVVYNYLSTTIRRNRCIIYEDDTPVFDNRYECVLDFPETPEVAGMLDWVNERTDDRLVDVKFANGQVYMAFEDKDDALIFKIRYL